jgi:hypothetical protein
LLLYGNQQYSSALGLTTVPVDYHLATNQQKSKVEVTLRLTGSWPDNLGLSSHVGPKARFLLLSDSCDLVDEGRPNSGIYVKGKAILVTGREGP